MKLFLSGETAIQFYRAGLWSHALGEQTDLAANFIPRLRPAEAKWLSDNLGVRLPVRCEVLSDGNRRMSSHLSCSVRPRGVGHMRYFRIGKETCVASPESAVVQLAALLAKGVLSLEPEDGWESKAMASAAPRVFLALLGTELLARYVLDAGEEGGFRPVEPRMSLDALDALLESSPRFPGKTLVKDARPFMIPNSCSPAETQLVLFASLPKRWGGRGLPVPILNLDKKIEYAGKVVTRRPDLLFEEGRTILEYNGGYHEGERANDDDVRRNQLIRAGYEVLVVNKDQLQNSCLLEEVFDTVALRTGEEGRRAKDYRTRRKEMRALVFGFCQTACSENGKESGASFAEPALWSQEQ